MAELAEETREIKVPYGDFVLYVRAVETLECIRDIAEHTGDYVPDSIKALIGIDTSYDKKQLESEVS